MWVALKKAGWFAWYGLVVGVAVLSLYWSGYLRRIASRIAASVSGCGWRARHIYSSRYDGKSWRETPYRRRMSALHAAIATRCRSYEHLCLDWRKPASDSQFRVCNRELSDRCRRPTRRSKCGSRLPRITIWSHSVFQHCDLEPGAQRTGPS